MLHTSVLYNVSLNVYFNPRETNVPKHFIIHKKCKPSEEICTIQADLGIVFCFLYDKLTTTTNNKIL